MTLVFWFWLDYLSKIPRPLKPNAWPSWPQESYPWSALLHSIGFRIQPSKNWDILGQFAHAEWHCFPRDIKDQTRPLKQYHAMRVDRMAVTAAFNSLFNPYATVSFWMTAYDLHSSYHTLVQCFLRLIQQSTAFYGLFFLLYVVLFFKCQFYNPM